MSYSYLSTSFYIIYFPFFTLLHHCLNSFRALAEESALIWETWIRFWRSMARFPISQSSPYWWNEVEEDSDLVCQPGVGWVEINDTLREKGLWQVLYYSMRVVPDLSGIGIPLFFPVRSLRFNTVFLLYKAPRLTLRLPLLLVEWSVMGALEVREVDFFVLRPCSIFTLANAVRFVSCSLSVNGVLK